MPPERRRTGPTGWVARERTSKLPVAARERHLILVNPRAGGGRVGELLPSLERTLHERDLEYRLVRTASLEHGCREAAAAAAAGEIPVVMSGDGLIGQIGGVLAGGATPLGVIPGGRGNDFARMMGIPTDIDRAVDLLATGTTRTIDVGEINGRRFLCIASCGFDSDANRIANNARFVKGNLVYLYAALRALAAWKPARFEVLLDGERHGFTGYAIAVANSKVYGGGMYVAPDAEIDDGLFDVVCTSQVSKLRALINLPKVFKGSHVEDDYVTVLRATEVEIRADREFAVYADGDHLADLPATIRVLPRTLNVIAPSEGANP
jgi:YegS/Rv2252/BmrU family lipid kinase